MARRSAFSVALEHYRTHRKRYATPRNRAFLFALWYYQDLRRGTLHGRPRR